MSKHKVLILGATSDIALALAECYARHGYDLVLAARNSSRLDTLCSDLKIRFGISVMQMEFDATDFSSHRGFIGSLSPLPSICILCFGYLGEQSLAQTNWSESEKIISINYTSAVSILNLISEKYDKVKNGMIIGVSSVAGERGRASNYIYGSAKAGLTTYLSGLRNRLNNSGVHVMTVKPGFVKTKMTEHLTLPPKLTAEPETVANAIYKAGRKKKNILYTLSIWKLIMLIIRSIPERIFKNLKL